MADGTVFIINGDEAVRDSLRLLLETHGMAVRECPAPAEFLAAFDAATCGCIVLDYEIEAGDGLAWLIAARARGMALPAVLLTDRKGAALRAQAEAAGIGAVVTKPPEDDDLVDAIRAALRAS